MHTPTADTRHPCISVRTSPLAESKFYHHTQQRKTNLSLRLLLLLVVKSKDRIANHVSPGDLR